MFFQLLYVSCVPVLRQVFDVHLIISFFLTNRDMVFLFFFFKA